MTVDGAPDHVLAFFRVKLWKPSTPKQIRDFRTGKRLPKLNPLKISTPTVEQKVVQEIVSVIDAQLGRFKESIQVLNVLFSSTIQDDKELLGRGNLSKRQQMAVQVRLEEKEILSAAKAALLARIQKDEL